MLTRESAIAAIVLVVVAMGGAAVAKAPNDGDVDVVGDELDLGASDPGDPDDWTPSPSGGGGNHGGTSDDGGSGGTPPVAEPGGGSVSEGDQCDSDAGDVMVVCFAPALGGDAPARGGAAPPPPPNPIELAQKATGRLALPTPKPSFSPKPPVEGVVGLKYWLWIPKSQWAPLTRSITAGRTTVTATVRPIQVFWDMDEDEGHDDGVERCAGPGIEWRKELPDSADTECGYTYSHTSNGQPGAKFKIRTILRYEAIWTCTGVCTSDGGDLGTINSPAATSRLRVGERQSVVIQ